MLRGRVVNGRLVLDADGALPEGARVLVFVTDDEIAGAGSPAARYERAAASMRATIEETRRLVEVLRDERGRERPSPGLVEELPRAGVNLG